MSTKLLPVAAVLTALVTVAVPSASARDLTLEERIRAQEAIERVYYSHQIGAEQPFEEAVPREVLERKVLTYLEQSVALAKFWNTPVTAEMLERELDRMSRNTRMPARLRELFAALDDDPVLIQECLVRPTLVDRLARNFYAFDPRFHATSRQEADSLRDALVTGALDPWQEHPLRTELELVRDTNDGFSEPDPWLADPHRGEGSPRLTLLPEQFDRWRTRLPEAAGGVSAVDEDRGAFHVRVLLEEEGALLRVAAYQVEKTAWETWWRTVSPELDEASAVTVASLHAAAAKIEQLEPDWYPDSQEWGGRSTAGSSSYPCEGDTWNNGALDGPPDPRSSHTALWTGSLMLIWGGESGGARLEAGGRYDPATDTWTRMSTVGAPPLGGVAVWTGSEMIVWRGIGTPPGGRYDPLLDEWHTVATAGAPEQGEHRAVWTGDKMIVWGAAGSLGSLTNVGGRYDPATDTWSAISLDNAPSPRRAATAVWTGDEMIVWGGYSQEDVAYFYNTGARYDPDADEWTPTSPAGISPRRYHTAVWTGDRMIVWGGDAGPYSHNDGKSYDPILDTWSPISSALPLPPPFDRRHLHSAVWTGTEMIVWGGNDAGAVLLGHGMRYDPGTDSWTAVSETQAPSPRESHTAVWTGSLMVIWGGATDSSELNTGGRYDPATDTWTVTSTGNALEPRYEHTAVWTGSLMVVWGGGTGSSYFDNGARYDPATDTWSTMSTDQAPSARWVHTAAWTGNVMVIWGGHTGSSTLDTGGRYDPVTDTWTDTSTDQAPEPRYGHTAVWTGDLMVVWGGYGTSALNTGGRYDPATDIWTVTTTERAPEPRWGNTAVWTGDLMVVWGGYGSPSYLNSGGRYDPVTDRWSPTSSTGAPDARNYHTAVWTGSLMVVWGGRIQSGSLDTGGRYDPATNSWTPTSMANAPATRRSHTAVWTGDRMIVWGGSWRIGTPVHYRNTGGRYDPAADTWTDTSIAQAPSARHAHTAVWTGDLMLVWGGTRGSGALLANGGRYAAEDASDQPDEVAGLMFVDETTLLWNPAAPGTGGYVVYDVARGVLGELPVGSGPSETCAAPGVTDTHATDSAVPESGVGFWYLVRARGVCLAGTYGADSADSERLTGVCP
jgi:N-acetylneuraminic acid mutarotase